jgi:molybdenum cofactor cytidylyltransferase
VTAVAAIVLAAGESSRMGRPKPLLPLDGGTFLGHLLGEIRASRVDRILVVLGHRPEVILEAMPEVAPIAVVNPDHSRGQLSSLQMGIEAVRSQADAILMCLADHPFVDARLLDAIITAHEDNGSPIVIPTFSGRRGHPTLFARSLFAELLAAPLDQGARYVVRAHASEILELPTDEPGVIADVDTPELYEEWLTRWREMGRPGPAGITPPAAPAPARGEA